MAYWPIYVQDKTPEELRTLLHEQRLAARDAALLCGLPVRICRELVRRGWSLSVEEDKPPVWIRSTKDDS